MAKATHAQEVPFKNVSDRSFYRWIAIIGVGAVVALVAYAIVPKMANTTVTTATKSADAVSSVVQQATDPFAGKSDTEIYSTLVNNGEVRGISSMNAFDKKMLGLVVKSAASSGIDINEATDANKFIINNHVAWVILFKNSSGEMLQLIATQVSYTSSQGALVDNTSGRKTFTGNEPGTPNVPLDGFFNDRTQ